MKKYQAPIRTSEELAEVKAAYKPKLKMREQPKLTSGYEVYDYLMKIWDHDTIEYTETMYMVMLNRENRVLGWVVLSEGGTSAVICDPKKMFQHGLIFNASAIILAHNHPSGNTRPSEADRSLTRKVVDLGKMLDMPVLDHVIVTATSFLSFNDEGLI